MASYHFPFAHLDGDFFYTGSIGHELPLNIIDELIYNPLDECDKLETIDNYLITNLSKKLSCKYYFYENFTLESHNTINLLSYNISSVPNISMHSKIKFFIQYKTSLQ